MRAKKARSKWTSFEESVSSVLDYKAPMISVSSKYSFSLA